jgi:hypothetical protein
VTKIGMGSHSPINQAAFLSPDAVNWLPEWLDEQLNTQNAIFSCKKMKTLGNFKGIIQRNKCILNMITHNIGAYFSIILWYKS